MTCEAELSLGWADEGVCPYANMGRYVDGWREVPGILRAPMVGTSKESFVLVR